MIWSVHLSLKNIWCREWEKGFFLGFILCVWHFRDKWLAMTWIPNKQIKLTLSCKSYKRNCSFTWVYKAFIWRETTINEIIVPSSHCFGFPVLKYRRPKQFALAERRTSILICMRTVRQCAKRRESWKVFILLSPRIATNGEKNLCVSLGLLCTSVREDSTPENALLWVPYRREGTPWCRRPTRSFWAANVRAQPR